MKSSKLALFSVVALFALGACGGDGGGDVQAFCDKQEEIDSLDISDTESMKNAIEEVVDEAPEEIRDDVEVLADALAELDEIDTPEEAQEIMTTEIQEASERIEKWVDENCEEG